MDLFKAIRELYEEKRRIDQVITNLEALTVRRDGVEKAPTKTARRRGRKGMTEDERAEVSQRMKEYWSSRRKLAPGKSENTATS